jgi:hypothetical protein
MITERNIPRMIFIADEKLINSSILLRPSPLPIEIKRPIMNAAPNNSKTIDTVVEVGSPRVLYRSRRIISVKRTAKKTYMMCSKVKKPGLKIPFRATSIIPLEKPAPTIIPMLAIIRMVLNEATFDPMAEFKKLTASLLTPTIRSTMAKPKSRYIIIR